MHCRGCGFIGEEWQQDFQPLDGGPVQSLSDAYSDYSVLLLIAAESEISVPEWLAHSEGTTVILIAELKWHTEFGHLNRGDMLTS
ncbi:hypothetical protein FSG08_000005, partial [Escherichia coli]|nr:hypothetical protein [Escherichia coli]